jgi:hypothetical protein
VLNELASVAQDRIGRADASKWASWAYLGRCCAVKGVSDGKRTRNHTYTRILVLFPPYWCYYACVVLYSALFGSITAISASSCTIALCCAVKGVSDGKRTRNHTYTRILVLMEQVCDFSVRTGSRGKKRRFLHLFTSLVWSSTIAMGGGKWGLFQPYY